MTDAAAACCLYIAFSTDGGQFRVCELVAVRECFKLLHKSFWLLLLGLASTRLFRGIDIDRTSICISPDLPH